MKHAHNAARHPGPISRRKAMGDINRERGDPDARIETLSVGDQARLCLLLETNPAAFRERLTAWRASNPHGELNIGGAGGTLTNLNLDGFTAEDFARIQLTGLTLEMPSFPDDALHKAMVEKGVKFREGYRIGERLFAKPLALHTIARRDMELALESAPAEFQQRMARLRADHKGRAIDLGGICVFRGDFSTLTEDDFKGVLLKGAIIGDVILPNEELYAALQKKGMIFDGSITIGGRVVAGPLKPDAADRELIEHCLESGARDGFLGHIARLREGNPGRAIDLGDSIYAFMPKMTGFKPEDFDGIQMRGSRFLAAELADNTMKKCLEGKGALFTGAIVIAGVRTTLEDRSR